MITYAPFWQTLKNSKESTYTFIHKHKISSGTIDRLRKGQSITTVTLNDLCRILNCKVEDVLQYIPCEDDQKL